MKQHIREHRGIPWQNGDPHTQKWFDIVQIVPILAVIIIMAAWANILLLDFWKKTSKANIAISLFVNNSTEGQLKLSIAFQVKLCLSILIRDNWDFSKLFTWIQVIRSTWITHTELGWIRTIQGPNWMIFRTIQGQTERFLEQYKAKLNHL